MTFAKLNRDVHVFSFKSRFAGSTFHDVHVVDASNPPLRAHGPALAQANSYGWHHDFEDVFIAQTAGVKDDYFRANTVARDVVVLPARGRFSQSEKNLRDVVKNVAPLRDGHEMYMGTQLGGSGDLHLRLGVVPIGHERA